ncbi:hypothetical protein ACQP2P_11560 [Dactylosporangium sp. CA-139114]|uniref:hypothetical protein n=1 Tax=Dactylosporangium sp. CA-139114 TaxID=3239931 RepID=UPI003D997B30
MDDRGGLFRSVGSTGKAVRLAGATILAALMGSGMTVLRGPVFGLLAFAFYGLIFGIGAVSMSRVRRWSAEHMVADASFIVPGMFFALLIIPVLPWWAAALIALAAGVVVVPFMVRRRRAHLAGAASQTDG